MPKPKPFARDLVREVKREWKRQKAELDPRLLAEAAQPGKAHLANEEFRNVLVAQSVLRPCMEATMDSMLPLSHMTVMELAIRLASYALSVAPAKDQDKLVELFLQGFAAAHTARLGLGVVIETGWRDEDGREEDNHPLARPRGNA